MVALRELFTTDIGLLSLAVLVFIIGMAIWFERFFRARIREEMEAAAAAKATPASRGTPPR